MAPLDVCDVLLGQPYMYQQHGVYESRPRSVTIRLGEQKYQIPEVSPAYTASLISAKQCKRLVAKTGTFILLMIRSEEERKLVYNSHAITNTTTLKKRSMDQILMKYENLFKLPTGVHTHCQVRHTIDLIPGTPLLNEPVYRRSVLKNNEIKGKYKN